MRDRASAAGALFLIAKPFNEETFKDVLDGVIA
jgi:two-component system chemotaxis response regulator CheY